MTRKWQEAEKGPIDLDAEPPADQKTKEPTTSNFNKVQIGDIVQLKIEGVGAKGDVFGRYKQIVIFVKGVDKVTPGQLIDVKITYVKQNCAFAVPA